MTDDDKATLTEAAQLCDDNGMPVLGSRLRSILKRLGYVSRDDKEQAALWRDLVLLDPMDLMVIFGGANSDKVLLAKLAEWIERKRSSRISPRAVTSGNIACPGQVCERIGYVCHRNGCTYDTDKRCALASHDDIRERS